MSYRILNMVLGLLLAMRPRKSGRQQALVGFIFALGALTRAIGLTPPWRG